MDTPSPQETFELFKNNNCFDENGFLDLEMFCVMLSKSFGADGILELSPRPRAVYDLLIQILQEYAIKTAAEPGQTKTAHELIELWVRPQNLVDWTPDFYEVYPDQYRTLIHPAGLIQAQVDWIFHIGYTLMDLPEREGPGKYYDWVKPEWVHVYAYIDGHHNRWSDSIKEVDRQLIEEGRASLLETLHKAHNEDIDFEEAEAVLSARKKAQQSALARIKETVNAGFYLEAITLQECLISNCLFNYITAKNEGKVSDSLYELLKTLKRKKSSLQVEDRPLFNAVDSWRLSRNKAMHGFIKSQTDQLQGSLDEFTRFSEETAKQGQELCQKVCSWYDDQSVNFMNMRFPQPKQTSVH